MKRQHKFDTPLRVLVRGSGIGSQIGMKRLDILLTTLQVTLLLQEFGGAVSVDAAWLCKTRKAQWLE